jgi:hypothetical protein
MTWTRKYVCDRCGFQVASWADARQHDAEHLTTDIATQLDFPNPVRQPYKSTPGYVDIDPDILERTRTRRGQR